MDGIALAGVGDNRLVWNSRAGVTEMNRATRGRVVGVDPSAWLRGSVAVVTGGAAGLGLATGAALAGAGARVAILDLDPERVDRAVKLLSADGAVCRGFTADVRSKAAIGAALGAIRKELGPVRSLVANAGVYPNTEFLRISEEEWDLVLDTNLKGVFLACQAVAAEMKEAGGGSIVTMSSGSASNALQGWAHYSASKAAVVALTKSMALELGPYNIRVNSVLPGYIDVDEGGKHLSERYKAAARNLVPRGRPGRPEDVASAVLLLLSPLADYISGATLSVDGASSAGNLAIRPTD